MKISTLVINVAALSFLAGCSSLNPFASSALKPAPLEDFVPDLGVKEVWSIEVGDSDEGTFRSAQEEGYLFAASGEGKLLALAAGTGKVLWTGKIDEGLSAGVAATADTVAVVDKKNALRAYDFSGKAKWATNLDTDVTTQPVGVAGLILVRTIDYAISAYSAESGGLVWRYQRQLPPLTLRGDMPITVNNGRVYAGFPGGRLVGVDINNGNLVWEGSLSTPAGTTEIERIADVTGAPSYNFREICAGSFQGSVGCLDSLTGKLVWSKNFSAPNGTSVDDRYLIANNELGDLFAFSRSGGKEVWRISNFQRRKPSTPVIVGRAAAIGDFEGYLHFINRDNGRTLARMRVGKESLTASPMVIDGEEMVVQSRDGKLVKLAVR